MTLSRIECSDIAIVTPLPALVGGLAQKLESHPFTPHAHLSSKQDTNHDICIQSDISD